jgi:predicted lipid-binding transport protein (Tim44 family)
MARLSGYLFALLLGCTFSFMGIGDAEAARMGGGKSFGSKPSYNMPYKRSNNAAPLSPSQPGAAQQHNQSVRDSLARRGGLMGMLGGLALGGLLGAMLFGGAFEHINFLDILLFGLIAFMLYRFFRARKSSSVGREMAAEGSNYGLQGNQPHADDESRPYERQGNPGESVRTAGFNTNLLFDKDSKTTAPPADVTPEPSSERGSIPANFDKAIFLQGAKAAYALLQSAWDEGDLAEIRGLTTDKVFAELQDQLRERKTENRTELLKVEAELLEVREAGPDMEASVVFDVILREEADERPAQVREIWHFVRSKSSKQPTWFLDGIQQMEA